MCPKPHAPFHIPYLKRHVKKKGKWRETKGKWANSYSWAILKGKRTETVNRVSGEKYHCPTVSGWQQVRHPQTSGPSGSLQSHDIVAAHTYTQIRHTWIYKSAPTPCLLHTLTPCILLTSPLSSPHSPPEESPPRAEGSLAGLPEMSSPNDLRSATPIPLTLPLHTHTHTAMTVIRLTAAPSTACQRFHWTPGVRILNASSPAPLARWLQGIASWMSLAVPLIRTIVSAPVRPSARTGSRRGNISAGDPHSPAAPGGGTLPDSWVRGPAEAGGA